MERKKHPTRSQNTKIVIRTVAPRRGAVSCRRRGRLLRVHGQLVSCSSSAMSAFPLEDRVLRTLDTRKLYQQTLEHLLISVCKAHFGNFQRHTSDYSSDNMQQRTIHVWGAALPWRSRTNCAPHHIAQTRIPYQSAAGLFFGTGGEHESLSVDEQCSVRGTLGGRATRKMLRKQDGTNSTFRCQAMFCMSIQPIRSQIRFRHL